MLHRVYLTIKRIPISSLRYVSATNVIFNVTSEEVTTSKVNEANFTNTHRNNEQVSDKLPAGWDDALPFERMPGLNPASLMANTWKIMLKKVLGLNVSGTQNIYEKFGDICHIRRMIGKEDIVMVFSPELTEDIFRNDGVWPIREMFHSGTYYRKVVKKDLFGDCSGLVSEQGENWYKLRRVVNPILMQPKVANQYVSVMDVIAQEFIDNMRRMALVDTNRQLPDDFCNEHNKWIMESIAAIAIDKRLGCLAPTPNSEVQQLINTFQEAFELMCQLDFNSSPTVWKIFRTPAHERFIQGQDFIIAACKKYIDEAFEEMENSTVAKPIEEQSVLEKLLKIDKKIAFAMALDMFYGGLLTTNGSTGATLYYLAKNSRAQHALRKELLRLIPTKDTPITKEALEEAVYLKATIKESLRLAPPSVGITRTSQKDMVLGGYRVPKGTRLFTSNFVMSRRDYPKPKEFIPERWLKSTKGELSYKNVSPFTTLPFGFGPRSCIGKRLANLQLEIIVAKVIRNFRLEWDHPDMRFKQRVHYGYVDPLKLTVHETD